MANNEQSHPNENENPATQEEMVDVGSSDNSAELNPEAVQDKVEHKNDYESKIAELNDRYLRLYSEFDNYRKRTQKEKAELSKWASEDLMKAILPVLDDFERGMKSMENPTDIKALKEGVALIFSKFKKILEQKGLTALESAGLAFDPDLHEAITQVPGPEDMRGKVIDEVEKGYLLGGKVIRYSKVVVGA
jgi:molecular chaperone GrpE